MTVDPQIQAFLDQFASLPPIHTLPVAIARQFAFPPLPSMAMVAIEAFSLPAPDGHRIPARLYRPRRDDRLPVLTFFHGGGWVIGTLDGYDSLCRRLAVLADCLVVSVDYRLAPEHKFPAAVDDAVLATRWVAENVASLGGDGKRVAVGGDSAGGNLAAVTAVLLRDQGGPQLMAQLLIYPAVRHYLTAAGSMIDNARGYGLDQDALAWFTGHYLGGESDTTDPRFAVALTPDLTKLPPALIITAEYDPLRDEGEEYAHLLNAAGNDAQYWRFDGMIHGFFGLAGVDAGRDAVERAARWLRTAFAVARL
jgi:acetyl esterase